MDGYESESNTKKYAIIGAVVGVVLLALGVGAYFIIRARSTGDTSQASVAGAGTVAGVNGAVPAAAVQAPEYPGDLPPPQTGVNETQGTVAAPSTGGKPAVTDPSLNRLLTDQEKEQLGYPKDWQVRIRAMQKNGSVFPVYSVENAPTDTDKDGLSDADEAQLGTDPNKPDTDGDGLKDGYEVHVTKTDPLKADTDGDGVPDGVEVNHKTDPLDPKSH